LSDFVYKTPTRTFRVYGCAKRGCDRVNPDYQSFGSRGGKGYCLDHVPLRARVRLWWQARRDG
jgi:hypothetical protein